MKDNKKTMINNSREKLNKMQCVLTGAIAGLLNGFFGGGGGMVVVPLLTFLLKREERKAHATAILIILPISILSGLLYAYNKTMELEITIPIVIGVTLGGVLGALLLKKLSAKWVQIIFGVVMAIAGAKILFF